MTLLVVLGYGAGGTPTIAFIVKDSSVLASAEHPYVAEGVVRSDGIQVVKALARESLSAADLRLSGQRR